MGVGARAAREQSVQEGGKHAAGQANRENIRGGATYAEFVSANYAGVVSATTRGPRSGTTYAIAARSEKASTQVRDVAEGLVQNEQRVAGRQTREAA